MARTFAETKAGYANMWNGATLTASKHAMATAAAVKICTPGYKNAFLAVQKATGVPWFFVAGILYRESGLDLNTYLGNGQSLLRKTTEVPIGRGPFIGDDGKGDFVTGCIDALKLQGLLKYSASDWTIEFALYQSEEVNGEGYEEAGINDPYVWAGTNWEQAGLFVSDHKLDRTQRDPRVGVAAIYACIAALDPSILQPPTVSAQPAVILPKPKVTPMTTTTTATAPAPVSDLAKDLAAVNTAVEAFVGWLPTLSIFVPQLKVVTPFIPVIQGVIALISELQTTGTDPTAIAAVIAAHLQTTSSVVASSTTSTTNS